MAITPVHIQYIVPKLTISVVKQREGRLIYQGDYLQDYGEPGEIFKPEINYKKIFSSCCMCGIYIKPDTCYCKECIEGL
jgi:hypothetical protein